MKKTFVWVAVLMGLATIMTASAEGDSAAGKQKSAACAACHGADGNSTNGEWPKLAGQHPRYTIKQLQDFKSGTRDNAVMKGMASPLSDQDMADIAAYFGDQKPSYGTANPDLVKLGQALYRGGDIQRGLSACMGCHGPTGRGNPAAGFPSLAGQYAQYTIAQLKAFRAMKRSNDPNEMMRNIAARMTEEDMEAVATFIQGLR